MSQKTTQHKDIIEYLGAGHTLTGLEALRLMGTMKLASRVSELKRMGYPIKSEMVRGDNGKHFCRYWLEKTQQEQALSDNHLKSETQANLAAV